MANKKLTTEFKIEKINQSLNIDGDLCVEIKVTHIETGINDTYTYNSGWNVCEPYYGRLHQFFKNYNDSELLTKYVKTILLSNEDKKIADESRKNTILLLKELNMFN